MCHSLYVYDLLKRYFRNTREVRMMMSVLFGMKVLVWTEAKGNFEYLSEIRSE